MRYKPSIPDNIKHWKAFGDDQQIKMFLEIINEFSFTSIDQDGEEESEEKIEESMETIPSFVNQIANHKIVQFKNNFIPKGLVPLEELFDKNDVYLSILLFILR